MNIKTIGIVGFGSFGEFIYNLAKEKFPEIKVKVSSSRNKPDGETFFSLDEVSKTDILFLCVPIRGFEKTINDISPLLGENTIVADVATVKKYTSDILRNKNIPKFIASHPMFGPYSYEKRGKSLRDLRIALCDNNLSESEMVMVKKIFTDLGLKILELSSDDHDKLIAETLFLTHLVGQSVKKGGFERTAVDTVSFGFLMDAVESVGNDEQIFHDVFKFNPYCKEVLSRFEKAENDVKSALEKI